MNIPFQSDALGKLILRLTLGLLLLLHGIAKVMNPARTLDSMSGMLTDDSGMQAQDLSPEAFLTKPFTSETLVQAIAGVLKNN